MAAIFSSVSAQPLWQPNGNNVIYTQRLVGIFTDTSTKILDVNGSFRSRGAAIFDTALVANGNVQFTALGTSSTGIVRAGTGGQLSTLQFNGSTTQVLLGNGTFADISATSGWKIIGNDLIFQPMGKMGVGIMVPTEKIDVQGNMRVRGRIYVDEGITILGTASGDKFESDTMKTKIIEMDSTSLIVGETRIDGNGSFTGNLGLGTTNPTEKLEVAGNIKASGTVFANQLSVNSDITAPSFSGINQLQLKVNSNIVAVFNAAGNMGIGTLTPSERLDVAGNMKVSGKIIADRITSMDSVLYLGDSSIIIHDMTNSIRGGNTTFYKGLGLGFNSFGRGLRSTAIGESVETNLSAYNAIILGRGLNSTTPMINTVPMSLMIGFNSTIPTVFVGPANSPTKTTGNVGISTIDPTDKLQIGDGPDRISFGASSQESGIMSYMGFNARRTRNDGYNTTSSWDFWGPGGTSFGGAVIGVNSLGTIDIIPVVNGSGSTLTDVQLKERKVVSIYPQPLGNGFGGMEIFGYMKVNQDLHVCKEIYTTEIHVKANWCDFVFAENYRLMTLEEREDYIRKNRHLPFISSAEKVEKDGASLGSEVSGILQNTEELTLYIIMLNKKIEILEAENKVLVERLNTIESILSIK